VIFGVDDMTIGKRKKKENVKEKGRKKKDKGKIGI
jgi:hypothetical protein